MARYQDVLNVFGDFDMNGKVISNEQLNKMKEFILKQHSSDSPTHQEFMKNFILEPFHIGFRQFVHLIKNQASTVHKHVKLEIEETPLLINRSKYTSFLSSLIHIFRNAIDHGIEDTETRQQTDKSDIGTIKVQFEEINSKTARIIISDDGSGLSVETIRSKALENKNLHRDRVLKMNDSEIMQLIFLPHFSTNDIIDSYSGRGIGLDAVKYETEKLNGKVWAESKENLGTRFIFEVPILKD